MSAKTSVKGRTEGKKAGHKPTSRKTSISSKHEATARPKKKKGRTIMYIALGLVVLIAGISIWQYYFGAAARVQTMMSEHLKEKYGKDFHVDRPHVIIGGFFSIGVPTVYEANAYPTDNPSITFEIESRRDSINTDKYVAALWTPSVRGYINPIIEEAFGYLPKYDLLVAVHPGKDGSIQGELPSFVNGLAQYGSQIHISVDIESSDAVSEREIATRVHTVAEHMIARGVGSVDINYKDSSGASLSYDVGAAAMELKSRPNPHKSVDELIKEVRGR